MEKIDVCFIFRQPRAAYFSIEKVFRQVIEALDSTLSLSECFLPYHRLLPRNIIANWDKVKKEKARIYHMTGDAHYVVLTLPKQKTLLTIHDCVFLEDTRGLKRLVLKYLFLTGPVRHAAQITTISQKSKEEIIKHTGCSPQKIQVIHNPVSNTIYYRQQPFNTHKPVILFLGTKDNKNLHRSIKALNGISCHLNIVGSLSTLDLQLLKENEISFSQSINITEHQIADKYAACDLVLFPSKYEGFGLPIIEGNKAGRVVVTSNIAPMTEIAADAACLVDPYDIKSIRDGVLKVLNDQVYREALIENGFKNVVRFEPRFIAGQYKALYQKMMS